MGPCCLGAGSCFAVQRCWNSGERTFSLGSVAGGRGWSSELHWLAFGRIDYCCGSVGRLMCGSFVAQVPAFVSRQLGSEYYFSLACLIGVSYCSCLCERSFHDCLVDCARLMCSYSDSLSCLVIAVQIGTFLFRDCFPVSWIFGHMSS